MWYDYFESAIGAIYVVLDEVGVKKVEILEENWKEYYKLNKDKLNRNEEKCKETISQLKEYFSGDRINFSVPISIDGTKFRTSVWEELLKIPYGETRSYSDIAIAVGNSKGVRAIGGANKANPISIIIPCHRVIGKNGKLTGYSGNHTDLKDYLLELERNNKNKDNL